MKTKEIKYIDVNNHEELEEALSHAFNLACEARDKAQESASLILHIKTSIGYTPYEQLNKKQAEREVSND